MKEIKAYVKVESLVRIVDCLEQEGVRDLAVTRVRASTALAATEEQCREIEQSRQNYHADVARIEIVCDDGQAERFVNVFRKALADGSNSHGRIFILNIEQAVCPGVG